MSLRVRGYDGVRMMCACVAAYIPRNPAAPAYAIGEYGRRMTPGGWMRVVLLWPRQFCPVTTPPYTPSSVGLPRAYFEPKFRSISVTVNR